MTTSGLATYNETASQLIDDALAMNGISTPTAEQRAQGFQIANKLLKSWQTQGCFLHTVEAKTLDLTASDKDYTLDADCLEVSNVRFRRDGGDTDLTRYSRDEYKTLKTKTTEGDPISFYIDRQLAAPVLYLYYTPENTTSLVSNGGNDYRCIKDHTSAATDEPGVGANTATYWELIGATGAYTAWALATAYVSDVVKYDQERKIEDISVLSNTLDIPSKQLDAFSMGLAYRCSLSRIISDTTRNDLKNEYDELFRALLADDSERGPAHIAPDLSRY